MNDEIRITNDESNSNDLNSNDELLRRLAKVKFSVARPNGDRIHHVNEADVRVVLGRLPAEVWGSLRAVHFNDESRGNRTLGYVNQGRREIALCALPVRVSFTRALKRGQTPATFGAKMGVQWPPIAIRRFMLYDVFLHELGHLQVINRSGSSDRLKYAREKMAERFAMEWYEKLWSEPFLHSDPAHNKPSPKEIELLNEIAQKTTAAKVDGRHGKA